MLYEPPVDRSPDYQLGYHAQLACIWEATARKPGNVHRYADFADTSYLDFITSAAAIGPVIAVAPHYAVGPTVCECVRMRRSFATPRNTNLGIALLFAPLAKASPHPDHRADVARVLAEMDGPECDDVGHVYYAIGLAQPGGLGKVETADVGGTDRPKTLRECMALAQDRDMIARQYVNDFADVFGFVAPALLAGAERTGCVEEGIIRAHLETMAEFPDSLIARKRGEDEARQSADMARAVLAGRLTIDELDAWLRAVGNARNPGTTADLIAAGLFVLLRNERLRRKDIPWSLTASCSTG